VKNRRSVPLAVLTVLLLSALLLAVGCAPTAGDDQATPIEIPGDGITDGDEATPIEIPGDEVTSDEEEEDEVQPATPIEIPGGDTTADE
jgi:hypothetical protein